jgi:nitrogen regulatory protein P-II 1
MKLIKAIVREERLPFIEKALEEKGIHGMSVWEVKGRGEQKGLHLQFRGGVFAIDLLPKVCIEVFVPSEKEQDAVEAVINSARTGKIGDGRIFVLPVDGSTRIRTGEVEV